VSHFHETWCKTSGVWELLWSCCSESHALLMGVNDFPPYFSYFLTNLGKIQHRRNHVMLLSDYKFNKTRCNEIISLLKSINEILLVLSIFGDQFG
jgi:hypothetical protein